MSLSNYQKWNTNWEYTVHEPLQLLYTEAILILIEDYVLLYVIKIYILQGRRGYGMVK